MASDPASHDLVDVDDELVGVDDELLGVDDSAFDDLDDDFDEDFDDEVPDDDDFVDDVLGDVLDATSDDDADEEVEESAEVLAALELDDEDDEDVPVLESHDAFDDLRDVLRHDAEADDDGLHDGEFVCRSCFMVKKETAMADEARLLCNDCV